MKDREAKLFNNVGADEYQVAAIVHKGGNSHWKLLSESPESVPFPNAAVGAKAATTSSSSVSTTSIVAATVFPLEDEPPELFEDLVAG